MKKTIGFIALQVAVATIFLFYPGITFDLLFPEIRQQYFHYDLLQMWHFVADCFFNDRQGVQVFQGKTGAVTGTLLYLWMLSSITLPIAAITEVELFRRKKSKAQ